MEWTVAIGVDTHKEVHVAVALDALGAQLESREIATTSAGYRSLLSWAQQLGCPVGYANSVHAAARYSWMTPPSRSRRRIAVVTGSPCVEASLLGSGVCRSSALCGRRSLCAPG